MCIRKSACLALLHLRRLHVSPLLLRLRISSMYRFNASRAISSAGLQPVTVGRDESKLFVGRFPEDTSEEVLKNFYSAFGPIKEVRMVRNSSNLHAFVIFDGAEGLSKAMESVPHKIGDAELFVRDMNSFEQPTTSSDQYKQRSSNGDFQLGFGGEQRFPNRDLQTAELSGTSSLQKPVVHSTQAPLRAHQPVVDRSSRGDFQPVFGRRRFPLVRDHINILDSKFSASSVPYRFTPNYLNQTAPVREHQQTVNHQTMGEHSGRSYKNLEQKSSSKGKQKKQRSKPLLWFGSFVSAAGVILYCLLVRGAGD
uniref:RRM domain-containing protein n=1 Tax=Ditylenchus dipsaci TaxID=166011 RepID=A0A915EDY3_9BILA